MKQLSLILGTCGLLLCATILVWPGDQLILAALAGSLIGFGFTRYILERLHS